MTPSERAAWYAREYNDAAKSGSSEASLCAGLARQLGDAVASATAPRDQVIAGALIVARELLRAKLKDEHAKELTAARHGLVDEAMRGIAAAMDAVRKRSGR
jgi:predicted amidohydrolase YtcJ